MLRILSARNALVLFSVVSVILLIFVWPATLIAICLGVLFAAMAFGFFEIALLQPTTNSLASLSETIITFVIFLLIVAALLAATLLPYWEILTAQNITDYYFMTWSLLSPAIISVARWALLRRSRHEISQNDELVYID